MTEGTDCSPNAIARGRINVAAASNRERRLERVHGLVQPAEHHEHLAPHASNARRGRWSTR
jgi:hypothetical protein